MREIAAVDTAEAAVDAARRLGGPTVLKLDATGLAHKTEAGGVRLGLSTSAAVHAAAEELLAMPAPAGVRIRGLLVSRQLAGVELILGGRRDAQFGPLVLAGLGGILAEALDDVAVRLAPVDAATAGAMLDSLRGARVLAGFRGHPPIDRAAVIDAIVALGRALVDEPSLLEVDVNPLISGPDATAAVDALVVEAGA